MFGIGLYGGMDYVHGRIERYLFREQWERIGGSKRVGLGGRRAEASFGNESRPEGSSARLAIR